MHFTVMAFNLAILLFPSKPPFAVTLREVSVIYILDFKAVCHRKSPQGTSHSIAIWSLALH